MKIDKLIKLANNYDNFAKLSSDNLFIKLAHIPHSFIIKNAGVVNVSSGHASRQLRNRVNFYFTSYIV